jgi:hypothetical protein
MSDIACESSLSALPSAPAARGRRLIRLTLGAALTLMASQACREDTQSPSDPEPAPALAIASSAALTFLQVSVGQFHTCGVTSDHRAFCWVRTPPDNSATAPLTAIRGPSRSPVASTFCRSARASRTHAA